MGVADDVIVQNRLHAPAPGLGVGGEKLAAIETLFLPREHGIDDCGREFAAAEQARGFHDRRDSGRVVIGPWRVAGRIHDVADPAVDMAADDHYPIGVQGAGLDGEHILNHRGSRHARAGHRILRRLHHEAAATVGAKGLETRPHP